MNWVCSISLLFVFLLAGCAPAEDEPLIMVEQAWVRAATGEGGNSAAYIVLHNEGPVADYLVGASVNERFAEHVEMHLSQMKDGVMQMGQVVEIQIPPRSSVELVPGSYHIMLINVANFPEIGQTLDIGLTFRNSPGTVVSAEIKGP